MLQDHSEHPPPNPPYTSLDPSLPFDLKNLCDTFRRGIESCRRSKNGDLEASGVEGSSAAAKVVTVRACR